MCDAGALATANIPTAVVVSIAKKAQMRDLFTTISSRAILVPDHATKGAKILQSQPECSA